MPKLFISYRRQDAADATGRLYDRLKAHFGPDSVFYDVDNIPFGTDFRKHIGEQVGKCDVLLAIIGEHWLGACFEDGPKQGQRRLDDPTDWVRIEIEAAMARGIPVIPVLVARARMPHESALPDSLQDLVFRMAAEVRSDGNYDSYTSRLIQAIEGQLTPAEAAPSNVVFAPTDVRIEPTLARSISDDLSNSIRVPQVESQARVPITPSIPAEPASVGSSIPVANSVNELTGPALRQASTSTQAPPSTVSKPKETVPSSRPATSRDAFAGTKTAEGKELVPGIGFRWCPAGTFTMGTPGGYDEGSPVQVTLTSGYWLGETVITQGQWEKLMGTTPWHGKAYVKEGSDYPANYIRHNAAAAFCKKLTTQELSSGRLPSGWKYVLPTEAQWEYGCRAGTTTKYSFGDSEAQLGDYGWFSDNADKIQEKYAHRVGMKKANPWGLRDMHGNVYEWCSDWHREQLSGGLDPVGPVWGLIRMRRGGGWSSSAVNCRAAYRGSEWHPWLGGRSNTGFRVAGVPSSK